MAHVDLHLHTTYSDGSQSPEEVVATAAKCGVTLIAITDHDEIAGIPAARSAGQARGVEVISGVEINTDVGREDVHILGYGFPFEAPAMLEGLHALRVARYERALRMLERLAAIGHPLDAERVLAIAGHGSIGRPHVARALVEAGHSRDFNEAFARFIGRGCPAYVPRTPYTPEQAIALIHHAGGLAGLAHPGKLGDPHRILRQLLPAGLDALEVYHSDHSAAVNERMRRLATQHGLVITGGSDSHGPHSPRMVPIGSVPVPDAVGEQFREAVANLKHTETSS